MAIAGFALILVMASTVGSLCQRTLLAPVI
jgi:hypothetical protein